MKNPNAGTGWADFAGSGDGEPIPVSTEGAELTEYKRIVLGKPAQHNPFADMEHGRFYYDAVLWAVANGVTKGTSDTAFQPNKSCTRAEVVTFLWRVCGEPAPTQAVNPFADVRENSYYYKAVLWAVETGITKGEDASSFAPDAPLTRGHIVTLLFRQYG